jgi:hypothetical protein
VLSQEQDGVWRAVMLMLHGLNDDWCAQNLYKKHTNNPTWLVIGTETVQRLFPTTNKQQYLSACFWDPDELQPLVQGLVKVVGRGFVSQRDKEQAAYNVFLDMVET